MRCVIQEESSGCGIAAVANILGKTYQEMKVIANGLGIDAKDESLWSDTKYVRKMLSVFDVHALPEQAFTTWQALPDIALMAIKYHEQDGRPFWHWVVFKRTNGQAVVMDSASYLPENIRTDFSAMQPKWFMTIASE